MSDPAELVPLPTRFATHWIAACLVSPSRVPWSSSASPATCRIAS